MKRTIKNCKLSRRFGIPNNYGGKCEGFGKSSEDDEPCEECKRCKLHYDNADLGVVD
ncbi:hypothetical protein [Anaerotignum propionicum]|uniref:Uncharacterized protein n=1 Tax=Anaerotignum propionicum DSM 1682 TaxID=991789 RepID=A0A0X1U6X4_ANAPI|nr:hypothetical protein [Anaerotignum propionicum]AMJ40685.1 hypothetical protein CPRO_10900 [Anaerotignum propionicum DSM 1682]SHE90160.1 hypothetical protein SAMN02745151_02139 [[Clostridium] propionicum DSM 1682] [Anaerotignum propionicum DSM 1682]